MRGDGSRMFRCAYSLRARAFSGLSRIGHRRALAIDGRRQALPPHDADQRQDLSHPGRRLLERGAADRGNAVDGGHPPGDLGDARTDELLAAADRCAGADPLHQRPARAVDRRGPQPLLRARRRAAAGCRGRDRGTALPGQHAEVLGRPGRQPRQRRVDRRSAVGAVLRRGRAAGRRSVRSRAAPGGGPSASWGPFRRRPWPFPRISALPPPR